MRKLEIKELAVYVPYGLKAEMLDYKIDYVGKQYDEIVGFHQWDKLSKYWSALTIGGSKPNIERIKPILRPLSDLDKLDGDFATSHSICKVLGNGEDYGKVTIYHFDGEVTIEIETNSSMVGYELLDFATTQLVREELLKSHYDIFGLIEAGLAIDINTLNKE